MTEMFREAWPPMSVPDMAPDDDDDVSMPMLFYPIKIIPLVTCYLIFFLPHQCFCVD